MTAQTPQCPRCASPLPVSVSDAALCPVCLLETTLRLGDDGEDDPDAEPPYQTITVLASGRSGLTYLATPVGTNRRVALKIVGPRADARDVVRRFANWRSLVAFERYPGVARLLDAGPAPNQCVYLASDYVTGTSLETLLAQKRLHAAERQAVAVQLDESLRAMHARGVAHMRITPARIRIASADAVRATIIGFGQALVLDAATPDPTIDQQAIEAVLRQLEMAE